MERKAIPATPSIQSEQKFHHSDGSELRSSKSGDAVGRSFSSAAPPLHQRPRSIDYLASIRVIISS
jgi:hypothetical protein